MRPLTIVALVCSAASFVLAADYGRVSMTAVAPGVYLFTTEPYGDVGLGGNAVAIVTDEGVVLFDTSGTPASGAAIVAGLRTVTDKPVRYVINSHWHWDHWGGNQTIAAAFPAVTFLSHEKNRDLMMNVAVAWNAPGLERDLPQFLDARRRQLAVAEGAHAAGDNDAELAAKRELLAADESFLAEKRSVTYTFPTEVFSDTMTLALGGREIRVLHARAITPGDTYVYLPKEQVLVAGDILVHPIPFAVGGSYPQDWMATLQKLAALDVDAIVPGHGGIERDRSYLHRNIALFQHVIADVKDAKARGLPIEQARKTMLDRAAVYAADLGLADSQLPAFKGYFLEVFVNRAYHELEAPLGDNPVS
ncbi:MAG TPA: MBL fold metallo-hydrolase [Vicinamibacterales bacterium]|nr:MBL fold metallo-hydrolase [Vicinamibacterales bacterium]